mmetsp:Transcript_13901/g.43591  ORF Transcript_13901/g.43591 Transcript_13901/m.43591 type:complete len:230 (-) Transcript_13901:59-748(-)
MGAKKRSTSASGMSASDACIQVGLLSLSTSSARTPSLKSGSFTTRQTIRYSIVRQSCSDAARAPASSMACVSRRLSGEPRRMRLAADTAHAASSTSSNLSVSSTLRPGPKQRAIPSRSSLTSMPASAGDTASESIARPTIARRAWSSPSDSLLACSIVSSMRAQSSDRTKCVAAPTARASAPLMGTPVSPRYHPTLWLSRGSTHEPPTSGKRPMAHSGIASFVFSVATR